MKPTCSIIIPSWNNPQFLNPCIDSIRATGALDGLCELIIVNNGKQPIKEYVAGWPNVKVLEPGKNLGWEGGLALGVKEAQGDFFCFQNDDTVIPKATQSFYSQLLWPFHNSEVAAVGPATTNASGWHSIFQKNALRILAEVSYLIFFTVMVRRSDYEAVGGIDTTAPGGDDLDLCMRFRSAGKKCLINPDAFIIHHAFKTGERVKGTPDIAGGWNSKEMTDKTNQWLIRKHGFKNFIQTMMGLLYDAPSAPVDAEGNLVRTLIGEGKVVELGCGFRKTVPHAIGVDWVEKGGQCSNNSIAPSVADIVANVMEPLPFEDGSVDTLICRHILEHTHDFVNVLGNWKRILKDNGQIIIAVPNEGLRRTVPLNPEHRVSFTPESLQSLMELLGFRTMKILDPQNGISFVGVFEKNIVTDFRNTKTVSLAGVN